MKRLLTFASRNFIGILLGIVLAVAIIGCIADPKEIKKAWLPNDAKEVKYLGNGWVYFELDDIQYLYNRDHRTITPVPSKK